MAPHAYTVESLIPHASPMVLLDEVLDYGTGHLTAAVTIRSDAPFYRAGGMPAHVAIEYMAQACGALAGIESLEAGAPVKIGLLLGTRNFSATERYFREGDRLTIKVVEVLRDGRTGALDCQVERNGATVATATVTVYQP